MKRYGLKILENQRNAVILANLGRRTAEYVIVALSIYQRFMRLNGINIELDKELLKKHVKKEETIRIFDYEEDESIIEQALEMIEKVKGKRRLFIITAFFTGLRGKELILLFRSWNSLRKKDFEEVEVIETGFIRRTKKSYLTMMPKQLAEQIEEWRCGDRIVENLCKKGVKISLFRKVHVAVLSKTMMPHEIDLLQGRLNSILVKHYVKHLREIAEKYWRAYKEFLFLFS